MFSCYLFFYYSMWDYFPRIVIMRGIFSHVKCFHAAVLRSCALSKVNLIEINLFLLMEKPLKKAG